MRLNSWPRRVWAYCSNFCLRPRSLISPSGTGTQSNSASASTRGASDSIACLFAFVRCGTCKCHESIHGNRGHTSQFSRIKQRPPATDLSGPKKSVESLTPRRSNWTETDAVDFHFDLCSFPAALLVPAGVFSGLDLLPVNGCLTFFFSRENESRRLMVVVVDQSRWWCDSR